ncbi:serine-enriched protein-like [Liolophura sinensis]|uniref:serine-enriched protein-like n=1 Tax=Liolophura sinensis TaxID=3198878 RepID=UPI00315806B0
MDRPQPIGQNDTFSRYSLGFDITESSIPVSSEESALGFMSVSLASGVRSNTSTTGSSMLSHASEIFTFQNTSALCDDLRSIITIPQMCDVMFLVGKEKVAVYGLKAILATRSRTFFKTLLSQHDCNKSDDVGVKGKFRLMSRLRRFVKGSRSRPSHALYSPSDTDHLTLTVPEFDPTIFRQLMEFIHTGDIELSVDNVIGMLNAADSYGVDDLRMACIQFLHRLLEFNTVFPLLATAQSHAHLPLTEIIIDQILNFIDSKAQTLLRLRNFEVLSKDAAVLVLSRRTLRATEAAKWDAALHWSRCHSSGRGGEVLRLTLKSFISVINFCDIPLRKLSQEILPLGFLQDDIIQQAFGHHNVSHSSAAEADVPCRRSLRKQQGSARLRQKFSVGRRRSDDSGFAVSMED